MGNICTVDMRLRVRKTNVAGLTKTLHYLMYSGGMMPSSKELQDFVQVLKQINGDDSAYHKQQRCIHTNWIRFDQMQLVENDENWIVQLFGNCKHSVSSAFVFSGGEDFSQLCKECDVDFSIASEEYGCDFVEEFNFIDGEMITHNVYDWTAYVHELLYAKWDQLDMNIIHESVEEYLDFDIDMPESKQDIITAFIESGTNPGIVGINPMDQAKRLF